MATLNRQTGWPGLVIQRVAVAAGAFVAECRNYPRGETCECRGYIYTAPLVRLALEPRFRLESSFSQREHYFLDVYVRR